MTRRQALGSLASLASFAGIAPLVVSAVPGCGARRGSGGAARRIVTLGPNVTEILFALGDGDTVVGVSRFDDYPPEALRLPKVGGMLDPSFEAIVALRPDAIAGARGPMNRAVLDRLTALGVRSVFPSVESLAEIRAAINEFARLVGHPEHAQPVIARVDARVEQVRRAVAGRAAPGVMVVFGQRPITVAGPGSFVDELIRLAGGRNVVTTGPHWPSLALETVLALAPEVVVDMTGMEQHGALSNAWASYTSIPAVREGRMVRMEDPMLSRPGPRVGDALAAYARAIHPGLEGL